MKRHQAFLSSDSGAVTVDWVVLSAAVVGLGVGTVASVRTGSNALASDVSTGLSNASVAAMGSLGSDGYTGPWVESALRSDGYYVDVCENVVISGGRTRQVCSTEYHGSAGFVMEDGSVWRRTELQIDDQDPIVTWTDGSGTIVDAPRFRDS